MRIFTTLVLVFFLNAGQSVLHANFTFNKISPEEMNLEKWLEKHPDQPAVVIGDIGECWFEFNSKGRPQYLIKRTFRMIILKPEGMDYGNFPIPFYETRRGKEEVSKLHGNVFNLENGKVIRTRIRQRHGYTNDLGNNWKEMVIPFPEIKVGSVFEIQYQIRSDFINELSHWQVQREIPVVFNRFVLRLPAFFSYMLSLRNQNIVKQVGRREIIENFTIVRQNPVKHRPGFSNLSVSATEFTWESRNVSPMLPEPFTDNINNYRAGISLELMMIEYPEAKPMLYSQTMESVRDYMFNNEDFGQFLINARNTVNRSFDYRSTNNLANDVLKATQEIRQRIKWNQKSGRFATNTPDEILKLGSGNSADVNLMLCVLLRQMGYTAHPILLSTVNNGRLLSDTPTISKFNYVIVAVEDENKNWILVDGTATGLPPGYLPPRALNGRGKLLLPDKPIWIDLVNKANKLMGKEYVLNLKSDGSVEGSFRYEYRGYSKHIEKNGIQSDYKNNALVSISNKLGIEKELIKVENLDYTEEPLVLSGNFQMGNVGILAAGELIFPVLLFHSSSSHPFQLEERTFPVNFFSPFADQVKIKLKLPDGYAIAHKPRSETIWGVDGFQYSLQVDDSDGELNILALKIVRNSKLSVENYPAFKNFQDRIIELHSQNTVISKK